MNTVGSFTLNSTEYVVYNTGYTYNLTELPEITVDPTKTNLQQVLDIPSATLVYNSKKKDPKTGLFHFLPYISGEMNTDIRVWKNLNNIDTFTRSAYSQKEYNYSNSDPEAAFIKIINNYTIVSKSTKFLGVYLKYNLKKMGLFSNDKEALLTDEFLKYFIRGGFNPASDYLKAIQLALNVDEAAIQAYLDDIGVINFTAKKIATYPFHEIFYYLVHFFGPPPEGNIDVSYTIKKYNIEALTGISRIFASQIRDNYDVFIKYNDKFDEYFKYCANPQNFPTRDFSEEEGDTRTPEFLTLLNKFETTNGPRLLDNIFLYLPLLSVPKTELTLQSFKQFCQANANASGADMRKTIMNTYSDKQLETLVPQHYHDAEFKGPLMMVPTRNEFVDIILGFWLTLRARFLTKEFGGVCRNPESIVQSEDFTDMDEQFISVGTLTTDMVCYAIEDIVMTFRNNTDDTGTVTFKNPIRFAPDFTIQDLKDIKNAVALGAAPFVKYTIGREKVNRNELIDIFSGYIAQAELQESSDYRVLIKIPNFAKKSTANRELVHNLFKSMFEAGMYMRQWKGPGHDYPLERAATGQELHGETTERKALDSLVGAKLVEFNEYLEKLPEELRTVVRGLKMYVKTDADQAPRVYSNSIQSLHERVTGGTECIRMSSAPYVYTGAYYLRRCLGQDIPGFSLDASIAQIV